MFLFCSTQEVVQRVCCWKSCWKRRELKRKEYGKNKERRKKNREGDFGYICCLNPQVSAHLLLSYTFLYLHTYYSFSRAQKQLDYLLKSIWKEKLGLMRR